MTLPQGDKTPQEWTLPTDSWRETFKKPLRRLLYPPYFRLLSPFLRKRFAPFSTRMVVDQWFWWPRGFEFELLRMRFNSVHPIKNQTILVAGCGMGKDIPTWLPYQPRRIVGVEYFNYQRAWDSLIEKYGQKAQLQFIQADLTKLEEINTATFDIVASDSVFEHLQDLPAVLQEFYRILKPGGMLYATFGPLWHCWGGDHFSGYDTVKSGYNHLLLNSNEYQTYVNDYANITDGLIKNFLSAQMFSYLRPHEYIDKLQAAGFTQMWLGLAICPKSVAYQTQFPEQAQQLQAKASYFDLVTAGLTIIYRKSQ